MSPLTIKDIAIVGQYIHGSRDLPTGEAPVNGQIGTPMSSAIRQRLESRLFKQINAFMDSARNIHDKHCKHTDSDHVDPDYITRLSTHEFFFYTQEPLTLAEFERLQNKIAKKAADLPRGIQFVLGSFAVLNTQNQVMNITPHIACGSPPTLHFIIKNHTSSIDVFYRAASTQGPGDVLPMLNIHNAREGSIPEINIQGSTCPFQFNNLIPCTTPGGGTFLTVIDICIDNSLGVATNNLYSYLEAQKTDPTLPTQKLSHMVISNWTYLHPLHCYGTVMHVDPIQSKTHCKTGIPQVTTHLTQPRHFGYDRQIQYELANAPCQTLEEVYTQYTNNVFKELEALKFGTHDPTMTQYSAEQKQMLQKADTFDKRLKITQSLSAITAKLMSNPENKYIRQIIADLRGNARSYTVGMEKKALRIENAMACVPVTERYQLNQSAAGEQVMRALASHRHWGKEGKVYLNTQGHIDPNRAAESYKKYRQACEVIRNPASTEKSEEDHIPDF